MPTINYGFYDLESMFDQRVNEVGVDVVTDAVRATFQEHNAQLNAFMNLFVQPINDYKLIYEVPALTRLQPLDEIGRARKIQPSGSYEVAFPLQDAGIAWGANFRARAKMTVGEVNKVVTTMVDADVAWIRDHIFAALYANAAWDHTDPEHGALTIKGLANGDSDPYLIRSGHWQGQTDNHYFAQLAAISDAADPYPTIYEELVEHPDNSGQVVAFIPTNLKATTQGLTGFHSQRDENLRLGANLTELVGQLNATYPGQLVGYHDAGVWVVEWPTLTPGYIHSVMTGGERPVAMRQEDEEELRGFAMVGEREDYPYWEAQYLRIAGFGGWNRVGAVIYQVGAADYAIPTGYSNPMP